MEKISVDKIRKPHTIKVKEFVVQIKEINIYLTFLPPPFNTMVRKRDYFL